MLSIWALRRLRAPPRSLVATVRARAAAARARVSSRSRARACRVLCCNLHIAEVRRIEAYIRSAVFAALLRADAGG